MKSFFTSYARTGRWRPAQWSSRGVRNGTTRIKMLCCSCRNNAPSSHQSCGGTSDPAMGTTYWCPGASLPELDDLVEEESVAGASVFAHNIPGTGANAWAEATVAVCRCDVTSEQIHHVHKKRKECNREGMRKTSTPSAKTVCSVSMKKPPARERWESGTRAVGPS